MKLAVNFLRKIWTYGKVILQRPPLFLRRNLRSCWRILSTGEYSLRWKRRSVCKTLRKRLKRGAGPSIWFLPLDSWFSGAFQRPQQMARAFAEIGYQVVYSEPWTHNLPLITKCGVGERRFFGTRDLTSNLHLFRCPEDLLPWYIRELSPDVLIMLGPHHAKYIPPETSSFVVYEIVDDHELFPNADAAWHAAYLEWVRMADVVTATSDALFAQLYPARPDTLLVQNGVRTEDWTLSTRPPIPSDMVTARRAPIVVGYHGAISEWFDWPIWEQAAIAKPDWSFVLVGPPYLVTYESVSRRVSRYPNMYYLGPKSYSHLPSYTAHFDVATIPFVLNNITHACSPIKLFEYMALGKPVVATPMREIHKYKNVLFAENPRVFVTQLENALIKKDDPQFSSILKETAQANTWLLRVKALDRTIESVRGQQGNIPRRRQQNGVRSTHA